MKSYDSIVFYLFLGILYLYMGESLILQFTGSFTGRYQLIVLLLLGVEMGYLLTGRVKLKKDPFWMFNIFAIYAVVCTLTCGMFIPLGALSDYLMVIVTFSTYYFIRRLSDNLNSKKIIWGFTIVAILVMFRYLSMYSVASAFSMVRNNAAYCAIVFIPFILCLRNQILALGLSFLVLTIVAISAKRGGTVCALLCIFVYLCIWLWTTPKKNTLLVVSMIVGVCIGTVFVYDFLSENGADIIERLNNVESEGDNGRLIIIRTSLNLFLNSNALSMMFGHGYNSVIMDSRLSVSAHNDFVELLYDFGMIGLCFYLMFLIQLLRFGYKEVKLKDSYAPAYMSSIVLFLVMANVSHIIIYPYIAIPILSFFAFISTKSSITSHANRNSYISLGI